MRFKTGIVLLSVAALCACGSGDADKAKIPTESAAAADPQLVEELRTQAEAIQGQLPISQANGVTVTAVEAKGAELVLVMQAPQEFDQASKQQMEQQFPAIACANPQAQDLFRRGATYTYRMSDPAGETFTVSVNRCAASDG